MSTDLAAKMRQRADADNLPADHPLRTRADAFESAVDGYLADPQTVSVGGFMGAWTRARRCWCDYTGESLI